MFSCIPPFLLSFTCMSTSQICFVDLIWNRLSDAAGDSSARREFTALQGGTPGMGPLQSQVVRAMVGKKPLTRVLFHCGDTPEGSEDHIQEDAEGPRGTTVKTLSWVLKKEEQRVSQRNWKRAKLQVSPKSRAITGQAPCARLPHTSSQLDNARTVPRCSGKHMH